MAGPYNLGAVWLQVLPSFDGIQAAARAAGKDAGRYFGEGYDEAEKEHSAKRTAAQDREALAQQRHQQRLETQEQRHRHRIAEIDKQSRDAISIERARAREQDFRQEAASERRQIDRMNKLRAKLIQRAKADPTSFNRVMREQVDAALKDIDTEIRLDVDTTEAHAEIARLQTALRQLRERKIDVDIDAAGAVTELTAIMAAMQRLDRDDVDIDVGVDIGGALAQLMALEAATAAAGRGMGGLGRSTSDAGNNAGSAANAFRAMNGILLGLVTIGPLAVPAILAVAGALAAAATSALGLGAALGVGFLGLSGVGDAVGAMRDLGLEERYGDTPATRRATNRQVRNADRAVSGARRGVADARRGAEDALTAALRRQEDAQRAVTDAERNLSRAREDAVERVADAIERHEDSQKNLIRTQERAQEMVAAAVERQADAERDLERVQRDARRSQEQLTRARRDAQRQIEDLNNALISGTLSEQDALYDLEEARYSLFRIQQDGSATQRERDRAQLAYDIQVQQFRELQLQNDRLATDQASAAKKGVEGSDAVASARQQIIDADQQILDAEEEVADAAQARARAERDSLQMVADAQDAVADAARDRARASVDAAQSIEDAERRLADSRRDVAEAAEGIERARADGAERILRAEERLADALLDRRDVMLEVEEGTGALATAQRNLAEAMDNLSPAGKRFATFLFGLLPLLDRLRWTAQEAFLPGLQRGMEIVVDEYGPRLVGFVERFGAALGDNFVKFGEWLVQPEVIAFFGLLGDYAMIFMEQFAQISPAITEGLMGIMRGLLPFTKSFGDALIVLSEGFAAWANSAAGQEAIANFFNYLREISPDVWTLFALVITTVVKALIGLAPYTERLLDFAIGFFGWLSEMDPATLGSIALSLMFVIGAFQILAGVLSFLTTSIGLLAGVKWLSGGFGSLLGFLGIGKAAGAAAGGAGAAGAAAGGKAGASALMRFGIIGLAIGSVLFGLFLLYEHVKPFRDFVDAIVAGVVSMWNEHLYPIFMAIGEVALWVWENILQPVFSALGAIFVWLYGNIVRPFWDRTALAFNIGWTAIEIVFKLFRVALELLGMAFEWLYENVIKPAWDAVGESIRIVWENVLKPIFDVFADYIHEHVAPVFEESVKRLGNIWNWLRQLFAKPIVWVVDQVINRGIIDTLNKVFDFFDIDPVGHVNVPQGIRSAALGNFGQDAKPSVGGGRNRATAMASGGVVLPGYTPGQDVHDFYSPTAGTLHLSGGEGVARPEVVSVLGRDTWDALNAAAVQAGVGGVRRLLSGERSYANGGVLDWIGNAAGNVWDFVTDPTAALRKLIEGLLGDLNGDSVMGRLATGLPMAIAGGIGDALRNLLTPGAGIDMTGVPGFRQSTPGGRLRGARPHVNAAAWNIANAIDPSMTMQAFNQSMAGDHPQGLAVDFIDDIGDLNRVAAYMIANADELDLRYLAWQGRLWRPGVGWTPQKVGYGNDPMHRWHVHGSFDPMPTSRRYADGGVFEGDTRTLLRDSGGWIPPGLSTVYNGTGKDEWMFTDEQLNALTGGGDTFDLDVNLHGSDLTPGDVTSAIVKAHRKMKRGGAHARR